jgi:predicted nucleotidyltransferase
MEIHIKKTIKAGNSSAVILPRAWLDKKVRVELVKKDSNEILHEILEISREYIDLKEIIGVYLSGSYAREEEDDNSDIDVLIITNNKDRLIEKGNYSILMISYEKLNKKLSNDLLPLGQMIKEAKPLLNSNYLDSIEIKISKQNTDGQIKTTKEKIDLIKKVLEKLEDKPISDSIAYTLVLRIRTLYIIEKLIKNKNYSKKEFTTLINTISKSPAPYEAYLSIKNNSGDKNRINSNEATMLLNYLEKQLINVKKLIN